MKDTTPSTKEKLLFRACHACLKINHANAEIERCVHCNKPFLPLRYFDKIHNAKEANWENYFYPTELIEEEDLIRGLFVLW